MINLGVYSLTMPNDLMKTSVIFYAFLITMLNFMRNALVENKNKEYDLPSTGLQPQSAFT